MNSLGFVLSYNLLPYLWGQAFPRLSTPRTAQYRGLALSLHTVNITGFFPVPGEPDILTSLTPLDPGYFSGSTFLTAVS